MPRKNQSRARRLYAFPARDVTYQQPRATKETLDGRTIETLLLATYVPCLFALLTVAI